jgi:hypothetical protein
MTYVSKIDNGGYRATYDLHCRYIRSLLEVVSFRFSRPQIKMDNDILNAKEGKKTIEEYIYDKHL